METHQKYNQGSETLAIIEGNRIIAQFIGVDVDHELHYCDTKSPLQRIINERPHSEGLLFDQNWDWLMKAWFCYQTACLKLLRQRNLTEYHYWEREFYAGIKWQQILKSHNALVEGIRAYNIQVANLEKDHQKISL